MGSGILLLIKVFVAIAAAETYCRENWHLAHGVR